MGSTESQVLETASADETQVQAIGTVVTVYGTAGILTQSGQLAIVEAGDPVYLNDVLATGEPGGMVVEFGDGSRLDLGRNSQATLDEEVYDASLAGDATEGMLDVLADSKTIDAALEELDVDALEPTASGGADGSEGNSFVLLDRSGQSTDPDAGLETDFLEQVFGELPAEESVPPVLAAGPLDAAAGSDAGGEESPDLCFNLEGEVIQCPVEEGGGTGDVF